jgi:hypothetical protein
MGFRVLFLKKRNKESEEGRRQDISNAWAANGFFLPKKGFSR